MTTDYSELESQHGGAVEVLNPTTVQLLHAAEIDQQIATAKKYPRSVEKFLRGARELATLSEETAAACSYALPRDGKIIDGPSARLAEILASQWKNCRYGARIVGEDQEFVTAQGVFQDLEQNTGVTFEVKRRIVNKHGKRYSTDMIATTSNAACSIALRNAVFKGIPKAIWEPIWNDARQVAAGSLKTLEKRRDNMFAELKKLGIKPQQVYDMLGIGGKADIGLDEMVTLGGLYTAIQDGDLSVESAFKPAAASAEEVNKSRAAPKKEKPAQEQKPEQKTESNPNPEPEADQTEPTEENITFSEAFKAISQAKTVDALDYVRSQIDQSDQIKNDKKDDLRKMIATQAEKMQSSDDAPDFE